MASQNKQGASHPNPTNKVPSGTKGSVSTQGMSSAIRTRTTVSKKVSHPGK